MKKMTIGFFAVALIAVLSAFATKDNGQTDNTKFAGHHISGGFYFIMDDPNNSLIPFDVTSLDKGQEYSCVSTTNLCTFEVAPEDLDQLVEDGGLWKIDDEFAKNVDDDGSFELD